MCQELNNRGLWSACVKGHVFLLFARGGGDVCRDSKNDVKISGKINNLMFVYSCEEFF